MMAEEKEKKAQEEASNSERPKLVKFKSTFDHSLNHGPNGESAVKHIVHKLGEDQRKKVQWDNGVTLDVIDEGEEHINLARDVGISVGKRFTMDDFGADGEETNFDKPEDFKIF